jgi:acyl-CoA synthetase (AMP-forming)/AMP-acid ligase II
MRLETIVSKKVWEIFSVFTNNCQAHPNKVACIWLDGEGKEEDRWTYSELLERARVIAAHLKKDYALDKGDRVLLVYEPGIDFFATFWACVGTGIIAVPVCPPDPFNPDNDMTDKLVAIWRDAKPKLVLTTRKYKDSLAAARTFLGDRFEQVMAANDHVLDPARVLWLSTNDLPFVDRSVWDFSTPEEIGMSEEDTVFLQYTSGSTGGAKGVEVQHRALGANCINCALLTQGMGSLYVYQFSLGVSWLPTFHDMGLIGFHVAPMLIGGVMVYFSPLDFIQNPVLWLKLISRYRKVASGAPPFALDLCARRVSPAELQQLDLSGLEVLVLGAEPIRAGYMEAFTRAFAARGFSPEAFITCFGMAENILHVAGKWSNRYLARKLLVDTAALNRDQLVVLKDLCVDRGEAQTPGTDADTADGPKEVPYYTASACPSVPASAAGDCQWLVSSGELVRFSAPVTTAREIEAGPELGRRRAHFFRREIATYAAVVDPATGRERRDGQVGEVWVCGPSKTKGYYNKPEVNRETFRAVMAEAVKDDTKAILAWAKKNPESKKISFTRSEHTRSSLERGESPVLGFLSSCVAGGEVEWLRTGDMGVVHDDNLFITGRIKDMLIVRGQNFYAEDLEHAVAGAAAAEGPLGLLRPGSAVAYSVPGAGAEEQVCVMAELSAAVERGPEGLCARRGGKHGDQMVWWRRLLMRYGGELVRGLSAAEEDRRGMGCGARARVGAQRAVIQAIKAGVEYWGSEGRAGEEAEALRRVYGEEELGKVAGAVRRAIQQRFLLPVAEVVLLAPRTVKKTSSGKKRRAEMARLVNAGLLEHRVVKRAATAALRKQREAKEKQEGR